jgi:hypothetical protein
MKTISKVILCGLVTVAIQSVANAQSLQVEQKAVDMLEQNQIAKRFIEEKLGVKTGQAADVNAALSKLTPAQQSGIYTAITAYATRASKPTNGTLTKMNNDLANRIFTRNGKLLAVSDLVKNSSSRSSTKSKNTCSADQLKDDAIALSVPGSDVTYAQAYDALEKGQIKVDTQNCNTPAAQMKDPKAKGNLVKIAECQINEHKSAGSCYAQIANINESEANSLIAQEQAKCAYLAE